MTAVGHLGGLAPLATLPAWLVAAADPAQVADAAGRHLPELTTAGRTGQVVGCKVERLRLRGDGWAAALPADRRRRRRRRQRAQRAPGGDPAPTGQAGAAANLPELGLELHPEPEDPGLPELPLLTDPERARPYLEALLREGSPHAWPGCAWRAGPEVLRYKAGNRCTIRYLLEHGPGREGQDWPGWSSPRPTPRTPAQAPGRACVPCGRPACRQGSWSPWPSRSPTTRSAGCWCRGRSLGTAPSSSWCARSWPTVPRRRSPGWGRPWSGPRPSLAAMHRSGVSDGARWAGATSWPSCGRRCQGWRWPGGTSPRRPASWCGCWRPPPRRTRRDRPTGRSGRRRSCSRRPGRPGRLHRLRRLLPGRAGHGPRRLPRRHGQHRHVRAEPGSSAELSARLAQVGALNDRFLGAYSELAGVSRQRSPCGRRSSSSHTS